VLGLVEHGQVIQFCFTRKVFGYRLAQVNAFLVDGLLIDTGPSTMSREMIKACKQLRLEQIVNTHHHEDHIGNNAVLQREFSLPIRAHRDALPAIRQPRENLQLNPYQRLLWGWPTMAKARRIGSHIRTPSHFFRVLPTPGHSPDHICLYEEKQGWLFAGDLLCTGSPRGFQPIWDQKLLLDSLRKVANLDLSVIFCASSGLVPDPKRLIQRRITYWQNRLAEQAREIDIKPQIGVKY